MGADLARARTPTAKAEVSGAAAKNPQRHRSRKSPGGIADLGKPSVWLERHEQRAFEAFTRELPWLKESHRVIVEMASKLRGALQHPDPEQRGLSLQAMQELRRCLAQLGATPADESKVNVPDAGDEDPTDAFFAGSKAKH